MGVEVPLPDALASARELAILAGPLVPATELSADDVLLHGLPVGREVWLSPPIALSTSSGWPLTVRRADVVADGELLEVRLVAWYELVVLAGFVEIRARDATVLERELDGLLEALANARIELDGDAPACVEELWRV